MTPLASSKQHFPVFFFLCNIGPPGLPMCAYALLPPLVTALVYMQQLVSPFRYQLSARPNKRLRSVVFGFALSSSHRT